MSGFVEVSFPADWAPEKIVGWLVAWTPSQYGLHLPIAWRDVLRPDEWIERVGHWPTFSITSDGDASGVDGHEVLFRQRKAHT